VDIDPPAFYELLRTSKDFPRSSQPSIATFEELFLEISREMDGIVTVLLSEELSGTLHSARAAAANLPHMTSSASLRRRRPTVSPGSWRRLSARWR
jgi:fatty acid-binding protein DegV